MRGISLWRSVLGQGHIPLPTSPPPTHTHPHTKYRNTHFNLAKQSKSFFFWYIPKDISLPLSSFTLISTPTTHACRTTKMSLRGCVYLGGRFNHDRQECELTGGVNYLPSRRPTVWRTHGQHHKSEISKHILGWWPRLETTWKTITITVVGQ